jgi:fibronectin type 3 domain-containing protein
MHRAILAALAASLTLFSPTAIQAQAVNACDLNSDGVVDVRDVQLATDMVLGVAPCTANAIGTAVCTPALYQLVTNATLGGPCHSVTLNWTASTSSNVIGYNVYRGTQPTPPTGYTKLTASSVAGTSYIDITVLAGQTYYFVATAVDSNNNESVYSTPAVLAAVPTP